MSLRLPYRYVAKSDPPCTFSSIFQLLNHLSKISMYFFWPSGQRCQKYVNVWKLTSCDRADIHNIHKFANSAILIFSSVSRGHLENVNTLLTSSATWSKKYIQIFERWSSSRDIEGNMQGGVIFASFWSIPIR